MSETAQAAGSARWTGQNDRREPSFTEEERVKKMEAEAAKEARARKRRKTRRKVLRRVAWTVILLILIGMAVWIGYNKLKADYRVTYDGYTATTGSISNSLSFSGTMQLVSSKTYTAASDQKVKEVYVAAGDQVSEGDRLIRLSGGETLTADFDGTVSTLEVEKGDEVAPGAALLTLADFDHMMVSVRIGESDIASVSVGQPCRVTVSSVGATFDETIDRIDYATYTGNNVAYYTANIDLEVGGAAKIYPGMQATVTVPQEEANNVIVLKMEALSTARDNTAFVYKEAADGTMTEVPVTVGVSNGNYVEIKSGVAEGETIYKVAEKTQTQTGLSALFSNMFSSQQVNRPQRNNQNGSGGWENRQRNNTNNSNGGNGGSAPGGGAAPGGSR